MKELPINKSEDMLSKSLVGDKEKSKPGDFSAQPLNIGLFKTHGEQNGVMKDISLSKQENATSIKWVL